MTYFLIHEIPQWKYFIPFLLHFINRKETNLEESREVLMAKCGGKYDIDDFQTMLLFLYFLAKGIWKTLCQLLFDPK